MLLIFNVVYFQRETLDEKYFKVKCNDRDIKPDNCLIGKEARDTRKGKNKRSVIHMVDFGLSKPFVDLETGRHIPYAENKSTSSLGSRKRKVVTHKQSQKHLSFSPGMWGYKSYGQSP